MIVVSVDSVCAFGSLHVNSPIDSITAKTKGMTAKPLNRTGSPLLICNSSFQPLLLNPGLLQSAAVSRGVSTSLEGMAYANAPVPAEIIVRLVQLAIYTS